MNNHRNPNPNQPDLQKLADYWKEHRLDEQLSLVYNRTSPSTMEMAQTAIDSLEHQQQVPSCLVYSEPGTKASPVALGLVALAYEQTQGRGQHQRKWESPAGEGMYLTFGFRLNCKNPPLQGLSLAAGIAVVRYCKSLGVQCGLKWPNDVLIPVSGSYRKLAGVLTECSSQGNDKHSLYIGVGINLYQQSFPDEVPGISLLGAGAKPAGYEELCCGFVREATAVFKQHFAKGFSSLQEEYNQNSLMSGARVLDDRGRQLMAVSVDLDGALLVKSLDSDELQRVLSGEITLVSNTS